MSKSQTGKGAELHVKLHSSLLSSVSGEEPSTREEERPSVAALHHSRAVAGVAQLDREAEARPPTASEGGAVPPSFSFGAYSTVRRSA
jgi:hypothetical protein